MYERFWHDYEALFAGLIPKTLRQEDPLRPYIESSPDTVNWGRPKELGLGESHYWGVWYGREPFEILRERMPRFMSEFGVQSFPMLPSISRFARPETDYALESEVMKAHQKSSIGNDVILHYIRQDYPEPRDFADFVYLSQVMQGRGIALGIRAQRAAAPYCMGSLYWQLNDAWPAVSWSSIDYYGEWKGLHYEAKRAFAPIILAPDTAHSQLAIAYDPQSRQRTVRLAAEVRDFSGRLLRRHTFAPKTLPAHEVGRVVLPMKELFESKAERTGAYVHYELRDARTKTLLTELTDYAVRTKELRLSQPKAGDYTIQVSERTGTLFIDIESKTLLKDAYIDLGETGWQLSDNFFDILPQRRYRLRATRRQNAPERTTKTLPTVTLRSITTEK